MPDKPKPGGYRTFQLLDVIKMPSSEIKRDIEATTRVAVEPAEFYRLLTKFSLKLQDIDKSADDLENIFNQNK